MWGPRIPDLEMEEVKRETDVHQNIKKMFVLVCFSPRGLLGLNAGSLKSVSKKGD